MKVKLYTLVQKGLKELYIALNSITVMMSSNETFKKAFLEWFNVELFKAGTTLKNSSLLYIDCRRRMPSHRILEKKTPGPRMLILG